MPESDKYTLYYLAQCDGVGVGGGFKSVRGQKGDGFGSFLSGVFRNVFPLLKSGAKTVGEEILNTGMLLLRDAINGKPLKESVQTRVSTAGRSLSNKAANKISSMVGGGIKRKRNTARSQSRVNRKKRKVAGKKKKVAAKKKAPRKAKRQTKHPKKRSINKRDIFN
jgi:hypothetical protein